MTLSQAFAARDQMNKQALIEKLSDDQNMIDLVNEDFKEGSARWEGQLESNIELTARDLASRINPPHVTVSHLDPASAAAEG